MCKAIESCYCNSSSAMYQELATVAFLAVQTILMVLHLWRANKERGLQAPVEETNADGDTKSIIV